ncbi:sugar ABC transporter ATP-binding protein [Dehalococcoidia bacterium]|nr:sugar ABC transporter ATP-binding protein [Dehalococcoidia bacterium]
MPTEPILRLEAIDKSFPGVHALDHVDFDLYEGETHVLLGENGAGKSTLVKILSGSLPKDSGRIILHGKQVEITSSYHARSLGMGMVYQELSLIPDLSVAENIFLGRLLRRGPFLIDWARIYEEARQILKKLGITIDPKVPVKHLDLAERQLVEIAKCLSLNERILLLDEPTSALSKGERQRLFDLMRELGEQGVSIIYISHHLSEVPVVGQRVTVLRDGKKVGTLPVNGLGEDALIQMMIGRELKEQYPKKETTPGKPVLNVEGLEVQGALHHVDFTLHEGEIVGIYGLLNAGCTTLVRALFGLQKIDSGQIYVDGRRVTISSPEKAIGLGLGYLTRDRGGEGLIAPMNVVPNITLASLKEFSQLGLLKHQEEQRKGEVFGNELRIQSADLGRKAMYLSGGNQQKVVLAKWLCSGSRILIFDEPTRGIDVGAKSDVFHLFNRLVREKIGILMISSELPEILAMADRIFVMRRGSFTAEYPRGEATQEKLLRSASQDT